MTLEDQDMITGMQGVQMALVCLMDRQQLCTWDMSFKIVV
jgi:hypothetical protein